MPVFDEYATHPVLLTFLEPATEAAYVEFLYVNSGFYGGKLWHYVGFLINAIIWFNHEIQHGFYSSRLGGQYWIGLVVTSVLSVVNGAFLFYEPLYPYREYIYMVTLFTHWPAITVTAYFGYEHPWAYRYVLTSGCLAFCSLVVQARLSRVLFFLVAMPFLTLIVSTNSFQRDYWERHSPAEVGLWGLMLFSIVLLAFFERNGRRAFVQMHQCGNKITEVAARIERTQSLIATFFARTPTQDFLSSGKRLVRSRTYPHTCMVVTDLAGFTAWTSVTPPKVVISTISKMFADIDQKCEAYSVEKVSTVGDSFFGAVFPSEDEPCVRFSNAIQFACEILPFGTPLQLRIGVHAGTVVAGFVGNRPPKFDLFGDDVKKAKIMEQDGVPGKVHVSPIVYDVASSVGSAVDPQPGAQGPVFTQWTTTMPPEPPVLGDYFSPIEVLRICQALCAMGEVSEAPVVAAAATAATSLSPTGSVVKKKGKAEGGSAAVRSILSVKKESAMKVRERHREKHRRTHDHARRGSQMSGESGHPLAGDDSHSISTGILSEHSMRLVECPSEGGGGREVLPTPKGRPVVNFLVAPDVATSVVVMETSAKYQFSSESFANASADLSSSYNISSVASGLQHDQSGNSGSRVGNNGTNDTLNTVNRRTSSAVNLTTKKLGPEGDGVGTYSPGDNSVQLLVPNESVELDRNENGNGTRVDNLGGVGGGLPSFQAYRRQSHSGVGGDATGVSPSDSNMQFSKRLGWDAGASHRSEQTFGFDETASEGLSDHSAAIMDMDEDDMVEFHPLFLYFRDDMTEVLYANFLRGTGLVESCQFIMLVKFGYLCAVQILACCTDTMRNKLLFSFNILVVGGLLVLAKLEITLPHHNVSTTLLLAAVAVSNTFPTSTCSPTAPLLTCGVWSCFLGDLILRTQFTLHVRLLFRLLVAAVVSGSAVLLILLRRVALQDDTLPLDLMWVTAIGGFGFVSYFADFSLRSAFSSDRALKRVLARAKGKHHETATAALDVMLPGFVSARLLGTQTASGRAAGDESRVVAVSPMAGSAPPADPPLPDSPGGQAMAAAPANGSGDTEMIDTSKLSSGDTIWPFNLVTVMFVYFDNHMNSQDERNVESIHSTFEGIERLLSVGGLHKIKTISNTLMCVGGINEEANCVEMACRVAVSIRDTVFAQHPDWGFSVGLHCGPCFGAVLGQKSLIFDIFGDTVNMASRMQTTAAPRTIQVTSNVKAFLDRVEGFAMTRNPPVTVKGKGVVETFALAAK